MDALSSMGPLWPAVTSALCVQVIAYVIVWLASWVIGAYTSPE